MNPLALTTFSTGPSDSVAAVDVYKGSGQIVNSIQDKKTTGASFDISSLLANGGKGAIGSAGSLLAKTSAGGVTLNTKGITDRLLKSAPQLASSLRNMSAEAQARITSGFKDTKVMDFKMANNTFAIDSSAYSDVMGYGDFVNDVNAFGDTLAVTSANSNMCMAYDIDSHASMLSGSVLQGSSLGIPKSYDFISTNQSVSSNTGLLTRVATATLPILAKNGDLGNMSSIAQGPAGQVFSAVLPNYAGVIKQNYSYGPYARNTPGAQVQDYANLISIFTGADPQWNVFDRIGDATGTTGTTTFNIVKLIGGSREFQELLAIGVKSLVDGDRNKVQGIAKVLRQSTVDAELKRFFPKLWQESYNNPQITKKNKVLDPRVVQSIGKTAQVFMSENPGGW